MAAVYATMQPQEELAALFSRNLTLNPMAQPIPVPAPASEPVQALQEERKIVYISQHYNHSAHIARQEALPPPQPASESARTEHEAVERVLREHSVDPSGLTSAQLHLFKTVDMPQQLRLIELWRVCPPRNNNPTASDPSPTWAPTTTTLDQEEALARLRYEEQQREQELIDQQLQLEMQMDDHSHVPPPPSSPPETVMSLDGTPLTPIQAGDGRWLGESSASYHYMEPYMAAGYEEMARREYEESVRRAYYAETVAPSKQSTMCEHVVPGAGSAGGMPTFNPSHADPVYKTTNVGVGMDYAREAAMADRYGRLMAMRDDEEMF
ncbi:hypothetical protein VTI74DRAFT_10486 [Chaetomium olivicolor]